MPEKIEKFDWKETLLSNIFWFFMILIIVFYFVKLLEAVNTLDDILQLLGIIVVCFSVIKLVVWVGTPIIVFKTKKGRLTYR